MPENLIEMDGNSPTAEDLLESIRRNELASYNFLFEKDDTSFECNQYHNLNSQAQLTKDYYDAIQEQLKSAYDNMKRASISNGPKYPEYDRWILDEGEKYLRLSFLIFGKSPASYMIWVSFREQFLNCTLRGVYIRTPLALSEDKITLELLNEFYNLTFAL